MKPAPFAYHRPQSLEEAVGLLAELGPEAKPLGGGQSLGPMLNMRLARPAHLVDLNDLIELDFLREVEGGIEIGGLVRHHRLATAPELHRANPLVAAAAATIGHYAIRQRGTLGGSLAHADPAAQLPHLAVTLGAEIELVSRRGRRRVAAGDFFQSIMTVDLAPDEIVASARFPRLEGAGWGFEIFSRRHGDFAIVAVAASLRLAGDGTVAALDLGLAGIGPVPLRLRQTEDTNGAAPDGEWRRRLAEQAAQAVAPETYGGVPADYRRELAATLTERALADATRRLEEAQAA